METNKTGYPVIRILSFISYNSLDFGERDTSWEALLNADVI